MRVLFIWVFSTAFGLTVAVAASSVGNTGITPTDRMSRPGQMDIHMGVRIVSFEPRTIEDAPKIAPFPESNRPPAQPDISTDVAEIPLVEPGEEELFVEAVSPVDRPAGDGIVRDTFNFYGIATLVHPRTAVRTGANPMRLASTSPSSGSGVSGGSGGSGSSRSSTPQASTVPSLFSPDEESEDGNTGVTNDFEPVDIAAVPVPPSLLLFGTALAGFGIMRRRRKT